MPTIDLTIKGLKEAKADLEKLDAQFEKFKDDPIKSKKIAKEFNDLSKAIDKTTEDLLDLKKAGQLTNETFDDINETLLGMSEGSVLPLSTQIGEMEDRMYQLAAAGETNSQEFKTLQKEAARLRGVIIETDKSVDLMAENRGLSVFAEGWGQVGQRLMSLDFEGAAKDAKNLDAAVGNLGAMGSNAIKGLTSTVGTLSKTFIKFGISLLANPIFIIATVITAIVGAVVLLMDKLGFLQPILDAVGEAFDYIVGFVNDSIQAFKDLTDWLGLTSFASDELAEKQIENAKKTQEALKEAQDSQIEGIDREIKLRQAAGETTTDLEIQKQEVIKQTAIETLKALTQEIQARAALGDVTKEEIEELKKKVAEQKKIVTDSSVEIQAIEIKNQKEIETKEKESYERRKAEAEAYAKARLNASRAIQDAELSLLRDGLQKELELNAVRFERLRQDTLANTEFTLQERQKLVELYTLQELQVEKGIRDNYANKQKEQDDKLAEFKLQAELDALSKLEQANEEIYQKGLTDTEKEIEAVTYKYAELINLATIYGQDTVALEQALQDELQAIKKKAEEEEDNRRKKRQEEILGAIDGLAESNIRALSAVDDVSNFFFDKKRKKLQEGSAAELAIAKKQFEINKKIQIGQAIFQGIQATLAAYSSGSAVPIVGAVTGPIFAAAAAVQAAVQIAKIKSQTFEGSSGGAVSAPSASTPNVQSAVPSLELFGNSRDFNNVQDEGSAEATQSITVNAVVSETEVTGTQERVNSLRSNAEL